MEWTFRRSRQRRRRKNGDGTFETRRAIEAGRRVAHGVMMGLDASDGGHGPSGNTADRLTTVVQQDPDATPSSLRSARVSGSGRYVVFISRARLVEADRNEFPDVYVLDLATGQYTSRVSGRVQRPPAAGASARISAGTDDMWCSSPSRAI